MFTTIFNVPFVRIMFWSLFTVVNSFATDLEIICWISYAFYESNKRTWCPIPESLIIFLGYYFQILHKNKKYFLALLTIVKFYSTLRSKFLLITICICRGWIRTDILKRQSQRWWWSYSVFINLLFIPFTSRHPSFLSA